MRQALPGYGTIIRLSLKNIEMTIQFNTDNHVTAHEQFRETLTSMIMAELDRFTEHITRVEVYMADENGNKNSPNDKRCTLEARVEGRPPIAATAHGDSIEQAVGAALDKLRAALTHAVDRVKDHHVNRDI